MRVCRLLFAAFVIALLPVAAIAATPGGSCSSEGSWEQMAAPDGNFHLYCTEGKWKLFRTHDPATGTTTFEKRPATKKGMQVSYDGVCASAADAGTLRFNTVATSGLVSRWKLDESSGTLADSVGGHDATTTGSGWTYLPLGGVINGALDCACNAIQALDAGSSPDFDIQTGAVSFWFKTSDNNKAVDRYMIGKDGSGPNDGDWTVLLNASANPDDIRFRTADSGGEFIISSDSGISADTWYHVALNFGTGGMEMYVDGVKQADTDPVTYGMENAAENFIMFNNRAGAGVPFEEGILDDVRVYNRRLSQADITALYTNDMSPFQYCDGSDWKSISNP